MSDRIVLRVEKDEAGDDLLTVMQADRLLEKLQSRGDVAFLEARGEHTFIVIQPKEQEVE